MEFNSHQFAQIASGPAVAGASAAICSSAQPNGIKTNYQKFVLFGGSNEGVLNNNTWIYTSDIANSAGVKELGNTSIKIYPNPVRDIITIEIRNEALQTKELKYQLCDSNGKVLKTERFSSTCEVLDISDEPAAVYYIRIIEGDHVISVSKRIKQ